MANKPTKAEYEGFKKAVANPMTPPPIKQKLQSIIDQYASEYEGSSEEPKAEPKKRAGRKPATAKPKATKKTATDIEKAKAEIKAKTGKTEEECEAIIEQYRALRTKAQEGKRKAEQASATNKKRVAKLEDKGDLIEGTNVKTADAVIETTAQEVAEKIEQQIEAVEEKAEKEAKAEVAKDNTKKTPTQKKQAVEAKVEKKVKEKTKVIVKKVVIDTSALLTSIAESLGKFDKDSQKEFLIKLRSDIDKLLSKYAFGGMTDGATQVMNIQQSNLSSSSVNPTMFAKGGGVASRTKVEVGDEKIAIIKNRKEVKGYPVYVTTQGYAPITIGVYETKQKAEQKAMQIRKKNKYATGGVIGQSVTFDARGEMLEGTISRITNKGDYVVVTDDGRTILADPNYDVYSLGEIKPQSSRKKLFGFFAKGGSIGSSAKLEYIDEAYASSELQDKLRKKLGLKKNSNSVGDNAVISFAYTDYGGDFLDKVAIEYFQDYYPENTLVEYAGYNGQNAFVFGEPAQQWIDSTEDYPLGFEDFESFYYEKQNEAEYESFDYFLNELESNYDFNVDREEIMSWLMEHKGGYYNITTQGLDFSDEDLTEELVEEGLIERVKEDYDDDDEEYARGGGVDGKIPVKKLRKVVLHFDGRFFELDKYPPYVGGTAKEWLGQYPLDLEDAKALVFELAPEDAYEYEEEINNAESIDDLKDILWENDFKNYQRDNTYNQSWWGGVVEWSSLTENGDPYDRALVFVSLHKGDDVRGNYGETKAFDLNTLVEDFPPYYARLSYYLDTPKGTLTLETEDMEGYTLLVVEDETGTYKEDDSVTLDELGESFDLSGHTLYAKGGGIKDVIVYDNGGETFDRYTIFTPDGSVYGMSDNALMPNGFNMYIGDNTEIEKGSHLGKKLKSVPESIKVAVERRMSEEYAQGGLTEHGLRVGDKITRDFRQTFPKSNEIGVLDEDNVKRVVNLDRGTRMAKGGKLWIDTKGKGGLKGVKPSRKNSFRKEAVKRGLTSGQLASKVIANPNRYKGINPRSAQLVKNMGVRKHGGSIGDILRNRRGE